MLRRGICKGLKQAKKSRGHERYKEITYTFFLTIIELLHEMWPRQIEAAGPGVGVHHQIGKKNYRNPPKREKYCTLFFLWLWAT